MLGCKPMDSPIEPNHKLGHCFGDLEIDREKYQQLVGRLIYLTYLDLILPMQLV